MTVDETQQALSTFALSALAPRPTQRPSEWCAENLQFDEAGNHGSFQLSGCEYIKEPLDDFANPLITDETLVWGSQLRKTGLLMGGFAWSVVNDPCSTLWVMPSVPLARKFSRQRLQKLLKKSPLTLSLIPTGANRHAFSTLEMLMGASTLNLTGSNSAGNLASTPCKRVLLDEMDKFPACVNGEADAQSLATQRTKDTPNPQRWHTSTPSFLEGLIWQSYLKGDQRRYFIPCPKCTGQMILAWSKNFTMMPLTGSEAFIAWDKSAKRADGSWDFEVVKASAHAVCPHCKFKIQDGMKAAMIRKGVWKATNKNAPFNIVSRQLSSLYSPSPECSFGSLAVKFLTAKNSLQGLQSFINGDLAEPYMAQDKRTTRVELISKPDLSISSSGTNTPALPVNKLLTVDCQFTAPHFFYVARAWQGGNSEGLEAGFCNSWEQVRAAQEKHGIEDVGVIVDSGFGARSDLDVYRTCARFSEFQDSEDGSLPLAVGWTPAKGLPTDKRWKDTESGLQVPYNLRDVDPFTGTAEAGQIIMSLLEFASDFYKDILQALREGKGGYTWSVCAGMDNDEYWRHMDGESKEPEFNSRTGRTVYRWKKKSRHWPNHWGDCENMQVVGANFLQWFELTD